MAEKTFPDITNKLNAPVRKTAFERQKEEAEAKRRREAAETAAVLGEFEEEHAADQGSTSTYPGFGGSYGRGGQHNSLPGSRGGGGGVGKRHFTGGAGRASGPGSLGPPAGGFQGRKRGFEEVVRPGGGQQVKERAMFAYTDPRHGSDEESDTGEVEKAAPRQTVQLSDLPVGTTQDEILDLLQVHAPKLKIERVDLLPPPAPGAGVRKSVAAIATLGEGSTNREIDAAITVLQRLYLGLGHRLAISRHLSSTVAVNTIVSKAPANDTLPFGAKVLDLGNQQAKPRYNMAAPPSDFGPSASSIQQDANLPSTVFVKVPTDLKQLKLINKTIEGLIKAGPEFEAALMQRPEVRSEEKWAWLFDPSSTGGVYFRWRLWYLTSGRFIEKEEERNEAGTQAPEVIFRNEAPWQPPDRRPRFERVTKIDEFLSDPEYDEEEEEYSDNEESKKAPELNLTGEAAEAQYLNPLHRARLTHLLARLPQSPAMLRRGDVARVSAFAFRHAGQGAEEIAQVLVANVALPLSLTDANPANLPEEGVEYVDDRSSGEEEIGDEFEASEDVVTSTENRSSDGNLGFGAGLGASRGAGLGAGLGSSGDRMDETSQGEPDQGKEDTSSAKLIGLYIISDVLHGCDTAGVRNTWKYKALIEKAFKEQQIFEQLGRMERDMEWGKVKADRWRSRITNLFDIWTGWSLYSVDTINGFLESFKNPPLTEEEKRKEEVEKKEREVRRKAQKFKAAKMVKQLSDAGRSEDLLVSESPSVDVISEGMGEKMDVDVVVDKGNKMDEDDSMDEKDMFGGKEAGGERPAQDPEKSGFSLAAAKVVSKGSQRPSTRQMLDD